MSINQLVLQQFLVTQCAQRLRGSRSLVSGLLRPSPVPSWMSTGPPVFRGAVGEGASFCGKRLLGMRLVVGQLASLSGVSGGSEEL